MCIRDRYDAAASNDALDPHVYTVNLLNDLDRLMSEESGSDDGNRPASNPFRPANTYTTLV